MSMDGHLAWDCGESYREGGTGTCCSQGVPSGFMILYLQSWLVRRFIYTFNQIFPGCKFPPRGKWNAFRNTISLRGHQGTIHRFAAAIYQMVPWWLKEWVRICERASFTSRDAMSESPSPAPFPHPHSGWPAKGRDGEGGPHCPSVPFTLSCWAAVPVEDKPVEDKWRMELSSWAHAFAAWLEPPL